MSSLTQNIQQALERRQDLIAALEAEGGDSWRVFHGRSEGRPGMSIDRYGATLLGQTWGEPASDEERAEAEAALGPIVWRHRGARDEDSAPHEFRELGLRYRFQAWHRGLDPWLFLDFRSVRRWLLQNSEGKRVLNCFSYTCGAGLAAAAGGASRVLNLDHGNWCLEVGRENAALNELEMEYLRSDYFPAIRQLAGLRIKGKARRRQYPKVGTQRFDIIVLDPPTWARSAFGAVDIVRDYPSLLKPALLSLARGGTLIASNHAPQVSLDDFRATISRTAEKAGVPLAALHGMKVDSDFPSLDGRGPLKLIRVSI